MSLVLIRKALEKRLQALDSFPTAWENAIYEPTLGTAYQRVHLLPGTPDNQVHGAAVFFELGIFQITLCYPLGDGPANAATRAQSLRAQYKRGTSMTESGVTTLVTKTPHIATGYVDGDRWCVPVSITWQAQTAVS